MTTRHSSSSSLETIVVSSPSPSPDSLSAFLKYHDAVPPRVSRTLPAPVARSPSLSTFVVESSHSALSNFVPIPSVVPYAWPHYEALSHPWDSCHVETSQRIHSERSSDVVSRTPDSAVLVKTMKERTLSPWPYSTCSTDLSHPSLKEVTTDYYSASSSSPSSISSALSMSPRTWPSALWSWFAESILHATSKSYPPSRNQDSEACDGPNHQLLWENDGFRRVTPRSCCSR